MKKQVLKYVFIVLFAAFAVACSERIDLNLHKKDIGSFLVVEAVLNDIPDTRQVIKLSESLPYFTEEKVETPVVSGAKVTVVCDGLEVEFKEEDGGDAGTYYSPLGFCAEAGKTYSLFIDRKDEDGNLLSYRASSTMLKSGCEIERIDYKYFPERDSTWIIGIWAKDFPGPSNYLAIAALNGNVSPLKYAIALDDKYYDSAYLQGFPIGMVSQTASHQKKYGPCSKPFEEGDVLSMIVLTLSDDAYSFISSLQSNSSGNSIPIISSQPANVGCNIEGDPAVGYFTASPVVISSCVVDDPFREDFK